MSKLTEQYAEAEAAYIKDLTEAAKVGSTNNEEPDDVFGGYGQGFTTACILASAPKTKAEGRWAE